MQGGELAGVFIGVLFNQLLSDMMITILLAVVLSYNSYKTLRKAVDKFKKETKAFAAEKAAAPASKDDFKPAEAAPGQVELTGGVEPTPEARLVRGSLGGRGARRGARGGAGARPRAREGRRRGRRGRLARRAARDPAQGGGDAVPALGVDPPAHHGDVHDPVLVPHLGLLRPDDGQLPRIVLGGGHPALHLLRRRMIFFAWRNMNRHKLKEEIGFEFADGAPPPAQFCAIPAQFSCAIL